MVSGNQTNGTHPEPVPAQASSSFSASLQLTDSLFPSGLYTLSHGLESFAQAELLNGDSLTTIVADLLRPSAGPTDATACALAMRAAGERDLDQM